MPVNEKTQTLDVYSFSNAALEDTEEYRLGIRELRRRLPDVRRWYEHPGSTTPCADLLTWSDASWLLVILNPALIVSDNLLTELLAVTDDEHHCAMPADPRGYAHVGPLDYASRPGFDRFVARLGAAPRLGPPDQRTPWLYLIRSSVLARLVASNPAITWSEIPALPGAGTALANHAFVHSYADYHLNNRSEMLNLLPADTRTLLDIGGGAGNFALAFKTRRSGHATLMEMNPQAASLAQERGIEVIVGDFGSAPTDRTFDCVAMLDVLEHLPDSLSALLHARQFIRRGGTLLLSVPNVGHWSVVRDLLEGNFDYQPVGILCNTHLRFFSRRSLETLLGEAGFRVERWDNLLSSPPAEFQEFLHSRVQTGITVDFESLATESFHVLARRDDP